MNPIPTIFVIFGVTGDLSQKKLLPALFSLYTKGLLPKTFRIVGFSRRDWGHPELHTFITEVLTKKGLPVDSDQFKKFLTHIEYAKGVFDEPQAYHDLKKQLDAIDATIGQCTNKLLYLSVAPSFYATIFKELAASKLNIPCGGELGWTRILVEKPFGKDTKTAAELERQLAKIFKEPQIFRIDHYLAKETLQNILTFRFANSLFEHVWNNQAIERVDIRLYEKNGSEERGDFYDGVGALRDVGQNHVLQMLALIAMERPLTMTADAIRTKRAEVLKKITLSTEPLIRGQYKGFTEEEGVAPKSQTETYFKLTALVNTPRWRKVPFVLESGKGMKESTTDIMVHFKKLAGEEGNTVHFRIQPNEGIDIDFYVKKPGFEYEIEHKKLSFSYSTPELKAALPDAYERVLFDCVRGDQTNFASTEEVKYSWQFITPIAAKWEETPLMPYTKYTNGPLIG